MSKVSSETGAIIYGVGLMVLSTVFVAFLVYQMQSDPDSYQIVYWLLASISVIPCAWGWAALSGIYYDKHGREAWWAIGRFVGRK